MASNFPTAYIRVASQTYVLQHIFFIEVQVHVPGPAPAACVHAAAGGPDAAARPPRHGHGLSGLREARARQVQRLRLRRVLAPAPSTKQIST